MSGAPLHVGLNGTALLSPLTGIGQYTKSLAEAMIATGEIDLDLFYITGWSKDIRTRPIARMSALKTFVKRVVPRPYRVSRMVQQWYFGSGAAREHIELYHEPNFLPYRFVGPTVITVHDLSWVRYPETHPVDRVEVMNAILPRAIQRVQHVLTDSEFVRQEVMQHFGVPAERVTTTLLAPRAQFHPRTADACATVLHELKLTDRRFFLCVGTLEPRKNVVAALHAHAALPGAVRKAYPLVLVGMRGWLTSRLEKQMHDPVERGELVPLGFVDDAMLAALYARARGLVYPSIYEGFGLPPLEAMASGTPAVVTNVSSLPEVAGDAALQVDPNDVDALRAAMQRLVEDPAFFDERVAASLAQAARFSWTRCARQTIDVYRQVLGR